YLLAILTSVVFAGCETAHHDNQTNRSEEIPQPVQWQVGKESCVLAFTPDGRTIVTGGLSLQFWDVTTGKRTFQGLGVVGPVSFIPDGLKLAFQKFNNLIGEPSWTLRIQEFGTDGPSRDLWKTAVGKGIGRSANAVAFAPDSRTVAFATPDEMIYIW